MRNQLFRRTGDYTRKQNRALARSASDHPGFHPSGFADHVLVPRRVFAAAPLARLEKSEGLFVDVAHRN